MTENEFKYWAFISCSPQDNGAPSPGAPDVGRLPWGDWWQTTLKTFMVPADFAGHINAHGEMVPERIDAIYCNCRELPADAGLSDDVREALSQSRSLVVICSPSSAKSCQVNEVVRFFKRLGRGSRILPVVIAGEPNADTARQRGLFADDECFTPAMRHPMLPDGTLDTARAERGYIFADARHEEEKREILAKDFPAVESVLERAKIQLIAGLIGVGFNGLWQREQKRRFAGFAEAQRQLQEAWAQARQAQTEAVANQKHVQALQQEARAAENKVLDAQRQLEEARQQVRAAQDKILEIQNLPEDAKSQIQEAQGQTREAQNRIQHLQEQARAAEQQLAEVRHQAADTQGQLLEVRQQVQEAQGRFLEAQNQADAARQQLKMAQAQVQESKKQPEDLQNQLQLALSKATEAEHQFAEIQTRTRDAESRIQEAQKKLRAAQEQTRIAKRLAKVFAVLAVLAALAAGIVWSQRKTPGPEAAKISTPPVQTAEVLTNELDSGQIREALDNAKSPEKSGDLAALAARIPPQKISETMNLAATLLDEPQRSQFREQLLENWVDTDVSAAFDWSCQETNVELRQIALNETIPGMAMNSSTNALTAFNWLQSQTNADALAPKTRNILITQLFGIWAANDPDAAAAASGQLSEGATREKVAEIILSQRIVKDPAAAADVIANLPPGKWREDAVAALCQSWVSVPAALAWAQTLPGEIESSNAVGQIIGNWAGTDFSAVTNTIAALPDGNRKVSAQLALAEPWAQKDALELATNALALPPGEIQTRWLTAACQRLATDNFADAAELARSVTNAVLRQNLLEQAATNSDFEKFEATAKYIAAMSSGEDQQAAVKGLVSRWTVSDPESALTWLRAFPETNSQPQHIQAVLTTWAQSEPAAAAKWLANLPPEATSDAMFTAFLEGAAAKYPEFAAQWTQSVTNETQRHAFQEQVARRWRKADPVAAQKWMDSLSLPEATKPDPKPASP
jgi:uncharacterized coiled-coil DUF342 family protein